MAEGIDFSWARPGGAAIAAAGKTFVMRYLYPDGHGGKGLDPDEIADYRTNGLLIGVVYESSALRALNGYNAGVADATTSVGQLAALGMSGNVVYFAVDFDATPDQYETIGQYLDGAASVLGKNKIGLYAGAGPIDALCGGARADYGWQTYAWSRGRVSANTNVYQYLNGQTLNGGGVDLCRNLKDDFGAFGGTATASLGGSTGGAGLATNQTSASWSDIQTLLNGFGFGLVVDGINGPNTTAALGTFQADHGLIKDYIVGPLTLAALHGPTAAPNAHLNVDGILGAQTITALQNSLGVTADGIIGPNTIRALQRRTGANPDGIMGPQTRTQLQNYLNVTADGIWGPQTISALQTRLNAGTF